MFPWWVFATCVSQSKIHLDGPIQIKTTTTTKRGKNDRRTNVTMKNDSLDSLLFIFSQYQQRMAQANVKENPSNTKTNLKNGRKKRYTKRLSWLVEAPTRNDMHVWERTTRKSTRENRSCASSCAACYQAPIIEYIVERDWWSVCTHSVDTLKFAMYVRVRMHRILAYISPTASSLI